MADMVALAVVQELVSRAISFIFSNREDQEPHSAERLEMAVSELEFVLERIAKLPITDLSLLCRRKIFKLAYDEGTDLLNMHRKGHQGGEGIWRSKLRRDDVRRCELFAELADKFLRDVETGCSLRQYSFCNPFVRHLLEGKTLTFETMELQGGRLRRLYMWPVCVEGRGVETMLEYWYEYYKVPEKRFHLGLMLRVSESTDIVATAVKCLQSMASQFKVATETAAGELTLMANNLQNISDFHHAPPPPWAEADEESHTKYSQSLRPDPVCCKDYCDDNNVSLSSDLSHTIPEQVILFSFGCYIISAHDQASPLAMMAVFAPHFAYKEDQPQEGYALEKLGDSVERRYIGIQEVAETVRPKATDCFINQPELTGYAVSWIARHGFAAFDVQMARTEIGPKASGRVRNQRNSKRRR
ncbi:hypothetical protein PR202_gb12125 [Eleusine coracana subsp. coracana]|uniref:Uncharacterized protein n=1 Tax=Eleusine coracana subsp. coracana TaxID=191504 RepID=A0AAV5EPK7_ELECO|nr:hypothetical protein PR202_gb12125 [Eleusine coracana subsp. coracana]